MRAPFPPLTPPAATRVVRPGRSRRRWSGLAALTIHVLLGVCALGLGFAAPPRAVGPRRAVPPPRAPGVKPPVAAPSVFSAFDPGVPVPPPRIRVSLETADGEVRLGTTRGALRLVDGVTGSEIWPDRGSPDFVLVVPEGGVPEKADEINRIQVGSFKDQARAQALAASLEAEHAARADAVWDSARNVWRVRVGEAPTPGELSALLEALRDGGYRDAWIVTERPKRLAGGSLRLLDRQWQVHPSGIARLVALPPPGQRVTVDGRAYRGLVEVRLSQYGTLLAINELNLEDYLRGVVPRELGPSAYPEFDALAAQAVAARTYALANLGQFTDDGYDVCDSPRCQVYGGVAAEHPLSDRAVRETAGEILAYDGAPIQALFTATCGGHTEDVANVFPEWQAPYLRGVECAPEAAQVGKHVMRVTGRPVETTDTRTAEGLAVLQRGALVAWGIVPRDVNDARWRREPIDPVEFERLARALAARAGKPAPPAFEGAPQRLALWRWLGAMTAPDDPATPVVLPGDEPFVLTCEDRDEIPAADCPLAADLVQRGVIEPDESGRLRPRDVPTREEALDWLTRLARLYDAAPLVDASVRQASSGSLTLRIQNAERQVRWAAGELDLFAETGGSWHPQSWLELLPGDKVLCVIAPDGRLRLLAARERLSRADDRRGTNFRWTEVRDRAALEESLGRVSPVGALEDIKIKTRGVSGRVASLELIGAAGRATVEGFRVRRALDLPETLFAMDIQRDPDGLIRRVTFRGRGWGHGVGLCQTGAVGMAQRGVDYRKILAHYYTGATLVRLPAAP